MNRIEATLVTLLAFLLLVAAMSGCLNDRAISAQRLGSDFTDSTYHHLGELSSDRALQRTRHEQIGLEAVSGLGLLMLRLFLYRPALKSSAALVTESKKIENEKSAATSPQNPAQVRRRIPATKL